MEVVYKEAFGIAKWTILLDGLLLLAAALLGRFELPLLIGVLFGSLFMLLNFLLMGTAVTRSLGKDARSAQRKMALSYVLRFLLTGIVIWISLEADYINAVGAIVPLFFPRLVFTLQAIFRKEGNQ